MYFGLSACVKSRSSNRAGDILALKFNDISSEVCDQDTSQDCSRKFGLCPVIPFDSHVQVSDVSLIVASGMPFVGQTASDPEHSLGDVCG